VTSTISMLAMARQLYVTPPIEAPERELAAAAPANGDSLARAPWQAERDSEGFVVTARTGSE
jgi:hypothetical protein